MTSADDLTRLASAYRVATSFTDWQARQTLVPANSIRAVLGALGADVDDPDTALNARDDARWRRPVAPSTVVRAGERSELPVHASAGAPVRAGLHLEKGGRRTLDALTATDERTVDGVSVREFRFDVPTDIPAGYHTVAVEIGGERSDALLIVTPRVLDVPTAVGPSTWGFAVQLYSVRSADSWGVGDLGDLTDLAVWSASLGAGYILVNPMHAAEPVPPLEPSPYLPSSRRYWSPLYLRVEDVPEFAQLSDRDRESVRSLAARGTGDSRSEALIDRDRSWSAKREALRIIHAVPRRPGRELDYRAYVEREGESLSLFAAWNALAVRHGADYRTWPEQYHHPEAQAVADFAAEHADEIDFQCWLQWQMDEQLQRVQGRALAAGMPVGIVHDLAVGVHPGGADAWRLQGMYATGIHVGAPPDAFNQLGQDWNQPPWRPGALADAGYAPFRDLIRNVLRHAGGVRVDHIIGLFRLWWLPGGGSPADGTYVRYDHEALIGILALEAERAGAVIVGEDLGVVEDSAREYLSERGIFGTSILWFERNPDGSPRSAATWRALCLASVTTHDLPPTAGYLEGVHVDLRDRLGLLSRPVAQERAADERDRETWMAEVRERVPVGEHANVEEHVLALHRYLSFAPSRLRGAALTDAVGDRRTQNQPGTSNEYPNWRIPLAGPDGVPMMLEDVLRSERARRLAEAMNASASQ